MYAKFHHIGGVVSEKKSYKKHTEFIRIIIYNCANGVLFFVKTRRKLYIDVPICIYTYICNLQLIFFYESSDGYDKIGKIVNLTLLK